MNLLRDHLSQKLQLAKSLNPRQEDSGESRLDQLGQSIVRIQEVFVEALVVARDHLVHLAKLADQKHVFFVSEPCLKLW